MASYDFTAVEESTLAFWKERSIYAKAKAKNAGGKKYYFLDGPPYTSGKVHLGTAWNKTLKDLVLRYKRMRGFDVWDRAGYDMHGLPTEHATQKKLGLGSKEDIERYGVEKFIKECSTLCVDNMHAMNGTFVRLGVWMDFEHAYQSIKEDFIEGEWWLVKRAHEEGRLYEGLKTMTWCPSCATALAKHECEYQEVKEESIFVKLKVAGKKDTFLVVWTTTPWTIPFNLAVMVNPELDYQRCLVHRKEGDERWIISTALAGPVIQGVAGAKFEVEESFPGSALEGLRYEHPFAKHLDYAAMRKEHPKIHTVVLSAEYVDTSAGSGLVHCAPGCGPEDYEIGVKNGLPPFNTLDEKGIFDATSSIFSGKVAKKDDAFFIEQLRREGALIDTVPVEHDYAHCWRCHSPVVFRATRQWFFKVEDLKERMVKENDKITWVPDAAYNAFDSWLRNLRDNSITKQRYWGTPLPVWKCDACGRYEVVGSKKELETFAGKANMPKDLHKPWIDGVAWPCAAKGCKDGRTDGCTGTLRRIPDILDVWVDAGTVSWNCLDYPYDKKRFDELFPAEFILEGKDQIRGWFNLLHVASMIAFGKPCFRNVYMHGFINDSQGRKMSKSLGNYILPDEVVGKYGADTLRYYAIGAANPGLDMNYNFEEVELKHRNLLVFWNLHNLLLDLRGQGVAFKKKTQNRLGVEERYLLSRLHSTIEAVTERMDSYRLNEVPALIESLLLDMSRSYIQLVREKLAAGEDDEKEAVLYAAATTYLEALKLLAPVAPFFAEQAYQDLKGPFGLEEESVHLCDWPASDAKLIDAALEQDISAAFQAIGAILAARDSANLGVRWPAAEVVIETAEENAAALERLMDLVKQQANVKNVVVDRFPAAGYSVEPNYRAIGKEFGQETGKAIAFIKGNAEKLAGLVAQRGINGVIELDGYSFRGEHLTVERVSPKGWAMGQFPQGTIFLRTELTPALEAEGFSREIVRRVQQLRKDAGLNKGDVIELSIRSPELASVLATHGKEIAERTGAKRLVDVKGDGAGGASGSGGATAMTHTAETKIKGKAVALALRKL